MAGKPVVMYFIRSYATKLIPVRKRKGWKRAPLFDFITLPRLNGLYSKRGYEPCPRGRRPPLIIKLWTSRGEQTNHRFR